MKDEKLELQLAFPPYAYTKRALWLILNRAEKWGVTPVEAEMRLLDELAAKQEKEGDAA